MTDFHESLDAAIERTTSAEKDALPEFGRCGEWLSHRAEDGRGYRHTDNEACPVCRGEVPSVTPPAVGRTEDGA